VPRSALLVMDVQNGIVERLAEGAGPLLSAVGRAIGAARAAQIPVVYVRVAFRDGAPEVSPRNKAFGALARESRFGEDDVATAIHADVGPRQGDVVVTKRRVSAFSGSDLGVVLRARDIDSLVLAGIATSGVVLSTLREAGDLDYRLTVLSDACADVDAEVHRVLLEKVFPRQAGVLPTDEWITQLGADEW